MIVVINPSGAGGHSFKYLHAYASHDPGRKASAERVEWTDTRNLDTSPDHAWKLMANTARNQNALKKAAGHRAGRAVKDGPVLHVVMSFDVDEPQDEAAMKAAADAFLSKLGQTKRLKSGSRKQYANEHQTVMYAHSDCTEDEDGNQKRGKHLHLMINKVHPETGLNLPDGNNHLKAQNWALEYSKQHGTAHKTPARQENKTERERGDYITQKRLPKNVYELEQKLKANVANDQDPLQRLRASQKRKDRRLFAVERSLKISKLAAENALYEDNQHRISALQDQLRRDIRAKNSQIREQWRPLKRALDAKQRQEQQTFDAMEASFFGRMGNTVKTVRYAFTEERKNLINRSFRIARNAADRKSAFEAAQQRARDALERRRDQAEYQAAEALKTAHRDKLAANHAFFEGKRAELQAYHAGKHEKLQQLWARRKEQRLKERDKIDLLIKSRDLAQRVDHVKQTFNRVARPLLHRGQGSGDDSAQPLRQAASDHQKSTKPPTPQNVSKPQPSKPEASKAAPSKVDALRASLKKQHGSAALRAVLKQPAREQDNERER